MAKNERIITAVCEEGICPLCGGYLEYGLRDNTDEGGIQEWTCEECGATGKEGYNLVFDGHHYDVCDANGNQIKIEAPVQEPLRWLKNESGFNTCPICNSDVAEQDDTGRSQHFIFCPYCSTKLEETL